MFKISHFFRGHLSATLILPDGEGIPRRLMDGSGKDSCLVEGKISDQKLRSSKSISPTNGHGFHRPGSVKLCCQFSYVLSACTIHVIRLITGIKLLRYYRLSARK